LQNILSSITTDSEIRDILNDVLEGKNLNSKDYKKLLFSDDIYAIGLVSNKLRQNLFDTTASFINNIILNYTNVCITYCKFCAFYRPPGHVESYTRSKEEILKRILISKQMFGITQILFQGGHNPNLSIEYYEEIFKEIKKSFPLISIHGLSASEIDMISKVERSSTKEVLARLKMAGLDSLPGAGAEILVDEVKSKISPLKIKSNDWIRIMNEAHDLGISSSATMMYGSVENDDDVIQHFMKISELQNKTKGFIAFIPWGFEPNKTQMQLEGLTRYSSGGLKLLKMIAISRIIFNGSIPHIQSSWLTNGIGMAQLALLFGADDFGGTLIGEEVVSATGARSTELTSTKIIESIKQIGFKAAERDNFYNIIRFF